MTAINAYNGENGSVIYEYEDGSKEEWSGGSRTWRNQNPGNVVYSRVNDWLGQIGKGGAFCVFNDPEMGRRATRKILANRAKEHKTLEQALHSYAPSHENDTDSYIANLEKWTGISRKTDLSTLNQKQMDALSEGIFRQEGWQIGTIKRLSKPLKTGKYIWHTAKDEKVRAEHAKRDGQVFDYSDPPEGGNPGEDYNCRCWAEPLPPQELKEIFKK